LICASRRTARSSPAGVVVVTAMIGTPHMKIGKTKGNLRSKISDRK
jgi:hypothetical protein